MSPMKTTTLTSQTAPEEEPIEQTLFVLKTLG